MDSAPVTPSQATALAEAATKHFVDNSARAASPASMLLSLGVFAGVVAGLDLTLRFSIVFYVCLTLCFSIVFIMRASRNQSMAMIYADVHLNVGFEAQVQNVHAFVDMARNAKET
eukprot:1157410-Pelagomonas_calceolata.AAC.2